MPALQEAQRATTPTSNADAYRTLRAAFEEAYRNMMLCSGNFQQLLSEINTGPADAERRARIASASQAYETSRAKCMIASAKLNAYLIAEIVSSSPVVHTAEAPNR